MREGLRGKIMKTELVEETPEKWGVHPEFPNYWVSSYGRVYSRHYQKYMVLSKNYNGYLRVGIINTNGDKISIFVHKLLLETFVGERPEGMVARHYPIQNPAHNHLNNLSWSTSVINAQDRLENDTMGSHTTTQIKEIKKKLKNGVSPTDIIVEFSMSAPAISNLKNNNTWNGVGEDISKYKHTFKIKKLSKNDACLIKILLRDSNLPQWQIAGKFNVHQSSISNIKKNKHFGDIKTPDMTYDEACIIYNKEESLVEYKL